MTHEATAGQQPDITLAAFSVVLTADNIDPSMINPDFLRHSGIVGSGLETEQPPVSTPVLSQATFKGGISVVAQPDRFIVVQQGDASTEDIAPPDIAKRLVEKVPHPAYKAIGINPSCVRPLDDASEGVATALIEGGKWMTFGGSSPVFQLKAVHSFEGRQVILDIEDVKRHESDGSESSGLLFAANIHRDISETIHERRIERLISILSGWKDDLSDFASMVQQFRLKRISLQ